MHLCTIKTLCDAKIDDLKISSFINQNVLKTQITMHDVLAMEISNSIYYLNGIKLDRVFIECSFTFEKVCELTTLDILHDEEENV